MQRLAPRWGFVLALVVGCRQAPPPQAVQFAPVQPDLFGAGGTLTDAWADVDGDGDPDRFVGFNGAPSRLYLNDGGRFADVAAEVGLAVERRVRTAAWGDFDADGDPDLLLGFAGEGPVTALYRNDGPAGFVDVAAEVGLQVEAGATRQASWVDVDGDGRLDLFLALRDGPNRLFLQTATGEFVDRAPELGVAEEGRTVGAVWFDLGDGGLDLLVGNMDGDPNSLWVAGPDGGFRAWTGAGDVAGGGRPVGDPDLGTVRPCVVDHDNDGDLDLFFANYGPNGLLERQADSFVDRGAELGLAVDGRYDTCAWGDFDHDGTVDLFVNGTVTGGVQYRDYLFRREGGPGYLDVTPPVILDLNADHGATWVDFDLDGDLDLALTGVGEDGTHALLQNLLRPEFAWHSLQVRVVDPDGVARRPGAEVRLYAAGTTTLLGTRVVDTGSGYNAQSDLPVHFGLPGGQPVDVEITVPGPGGRRSGRVEGVDPADLQGRVLTVRVADDGTVAAVDGET